MRSLRIVALSLVSLAACSVEAAEVAEERAMVTSKLYYTVRLPRRIGGGTHQTQLSRHYRPDKIHAPGSKRPKNVYSRVTIPETGADGLPVRVDLSKEAPPPGDQGQTSSCSTWASGYSVMGWWANHSKLSGAPYAPMFLYSQIVKGSCDEGTFIPDSLEILKSQGIASDVSYQPMQDNLDCSQVRLDNATRSDAALHRITGYEPLEPNDPLTSLKRQLAAGRPVVIGIATYNNLENADADHVLIEAPESNENLGGHAIAAFGYDEKGVWILNSWAKTWGREGWGQLSWSYLASTDSEGQPTLMDGYAITGVVAGATPP